MGDGEDFCLLLVLLLVRVWHGNKSECHFGWALGLVGSLVLVAPVVG